ncbi:hypothetical protein B0H67DRAFT_677843 [Lasiosphaeris hirsuta]|uniref:ATP-grasp domain-containing protein n=1 Tax=Lasiosphaeris hirsuta TaxID=260670 RepID=A0AA40B956_9PEZI|nr:hypothetical protein B0H67DRAFT_677843 [Lasiosphaeris hirsuta]
MDSIITFWEQYQADVTRADKRLGLPVLASPESYRIATDNAEEAVWLAQERKFEFPAIVKPCRGYSSDGVFHVGSLSELSTAASSINTERHGNAFVVEKYCSGPEVDANFVLLDGEVIFFESSDDFPKTAEDPSASTNGSNPVAAGNLHELNSVFPSALPQKELDLIRDNFHDIISRLGFKSGILHLEGLKPPTPWLIEINPRPPGMKGTQIIESTWGVDYWGLGMLLSFSDMPRVRALSQPYELKPQYTCVMVFISAEYDPTCEGIFDSDGIFAELFARRPDLAQHVSRSGCLAARGQRILYPHTAVNTFIAYFNVFSRVSRREAPELADVVRQEVRFEFR